MVPKFNWDKKQFISIFSFPKDNNIIKFLKFLYQLFYSATKRFQLDEDLIRAASISYAIIVSFIPTLLVAFIVAANFINIRDYEELAREYVRKNGIPIDVSVYFNFIYELLNNTAALTGIGFLFLLISTTSVLRNLEDSINKIWHVRSKRPVIQKISEFILIIVFGPILLGIGITVGQKILNEFSAPSLIKMVEFQNSEIILGNKWMLLERQETGKFKLRNFLNRVDFDFQRETIVFDPETNSVIDSKELTNMVHRLKKATKADAKDSYLTDITVIDNDIYIISDNGTLYYSRDGGNYWLVRKFQRKQINLLINANFQRIYFLDKNTGLILGKPGIILKTYDRGENWYPKMNPKIKEGLKDIAKIREGVYLAVGESLSAYITYDKGETWEPFQPIKNLIQGKESFNSIKVYDNHIYICGDSGIILYSKDSGYTWNKKDLAFKKIDFHDILFIDDKNGILIGDSGNVRFTNDGGILWRQAKLNSNVDLISSYYNKKTKEVFILGKNHHILVSKTPGSIDEFKIIEKTPFWRLALGALGRFFLPLGVLFLIFLYIYKTLPYTYVRLYAAASGAIVTSIALVMFLIGFQFYLEYFSIGKFAIYGTFAAIPLLLVLIYISTIIILFGCEISFLVQHKNLITVDYHRRNLQELEKKQIWKGIQVLYKIHVNYMKGKGEITDNELLKTCTLEPKDLDQILEIYLRNNLISRTSSGNILPNLSPDKINLEYLTDILSPCGYDITDYNPKDIFIKEVKQLFDEYSQARKKIFGKKTLADLLIHSNKT